MALWDRNQIKPRFTQAQDLERQITERFPHPEDQKAARKEYGRCEDRVKAANIKLQASLKPDKPGLHLTPKGFQQSRAVKADNLKADRDHKDELRQAIAERDQALKDIETARAEKAKTPEKTDQREPEIPEKTTAQAMPGEKDHAPEKDRQSRQAEPERSDADRSEARADAEPEHESPEITGQDQASTQEAEVQQTRSWTPEEREARIAAIKAEREARDAKGAAENTLDDDPGRGL